MTDDVKSKNIFKKNSSRNLLKEENDIDYGKKRPSLIKYYIFSSFKWIISYWYITLPAIFIGVLVFGTASIQYVKGNNKPVWGMRVDNLEGTKILKASAKKLNTTEASKYAHYKIYISGPEIHIELGLKDFDKKSYQSLEKEITKNYKKLLYSTGNVKEKIKHQYSVTAIVAGPNPESGDNLHAVKPKLKNNFTYYHK